MGSRIDVGADELKVFLQETESLLEVLDDAFVRLEQEAENEQLLQEIFRAAHTLKGSSAMLGLDPMAHLTHCMEDTLDRLRKRELGVGVELIDALLVSLDGLKEMAGRVAEGAELDLDTAPLVAQLEAAAAGSTADSPAAAHRSLGERVAEDAGLKRTAAAAKKRGGLRYVRVEIDPGSDWMAVRAFQVLNGLEAHGMILASSPSSEEVQHGAGAPLLEVLMDSEMEDADLAALVEDISEIVGVSIARSLPRRRSGGKQAATATAASPAQDATTPEPEPAEPAAGGEAGAEVPSSAVVGTRVEGLQSTVRIDVEQLDALMNLVGELAIDRTRVDQLGRLLQQRYHDDALVASLTDASSHLAKVTDELHDRMMQVRMLPIGVLFSKFPRLVRDLARSLEKDVRLVIEGEATEIDRSVIEKIKDPLVHLIRNAVDHGVELPEERLRAGKPAQAQVRLTAEHVQGRIVISLGDDGKGMDPARLRENAVRRGVLTADQAERMGDLESIDLVFRPGFSTAAATTEVSGRGVGMDVVRRHIESLNGRVEVETESGRGTTFRLVLPLTLATLRCLLVRSGPTTYALPLSYVDETLRPEPGQIVTVGGRPVLRLRGSVMSVAWLDDALGATRAEKRGEPWIVVVRASDRETDRPVAIAVDELIEQQEIVVKPLDRELGRARGIAGASILGDGQVVLIVDVPGLLQGAHGGVAGEPEGRAAA